MNKAFLVFGVAGVLTYSVPSIPTKAALSNTDVTYIDEIQPTAAGLICQYDLSVSASTGILYINGKTIASDTMKSVGFTDMKIQYSSDNKNWHNGTTIGDLLKSNSVNYRLSNYSVSVQGGYYYRVTCSHYAKESGLLGSSQSISNTSNSVWID